MASEFARTHPHEALSILFSNNASGIDTRNVLQDDLRSAGVPVAASEGYELGATDFRTQLAKIKASGAKFGYLIAFSSAEFARVLRQSKELGLDLRWFSYSGLETKETLDLASDAADGVIYSYPAYSAESRSVEQFQGRYKAKYGSWADIYTVTSYDAVKLIAFVVKRNGERSADIQAGLRKENQYPGLFGPVVFATKQCVTPRLTWKTVRSGAYVPLGPIAQ